MANNEDLTFKINSETMDDTIDNLTTTAAEIKEMCETARKIVQDKLTAHGVPGDIAETIIAGYDRDVISKVEQNNAANESYIRKSENVNQAFRETQEKNKALF